MLGYNRTPMKIAIGSDHAGFELKQTLARQLADAGHELVDVGAFEYVAGDDYPDFALAAARKVCAGEAERAVICCGSGVGACVAANKVKGVRACLCHDTYSAHQGVEHDDMNVICLGGKIVGAALAGEIVESFVSAVYTPKESFQRRLDKVLKAEADG